ncbi:uncharacterized protein BDR25DRAFT_358427 [Lindgomyces ingoldianus]|uniref:Uncharacterized protein n=1 Tax=Lindgomyces ingoldianus TaxID=673940 RepID=A0ACB6QMD0_9PLEO|nr:uncharacterized protein BDR25DRAFT_358427 [Lindgomyces ingoldianus]KAF2467738.1 hypothetical protein BDR25DRAFT_358427 [Lindgomyces ingoldianus]
MDLDICDKLMPSIALTNNKTGSGVVLHAVPPSRDLEAFLNGEDNRRAGHVRGIALIASGQRFPQTVFEFDSFGEFAELVLHTTLSVNGSLTRVFCSLVSRTVAAPPNPAYAQLSETSKQTGMHTEFLSCKVKDGVELGVEVAFLADEDGFWVSLDMPI